MKYKKFVKYSLDTNLYTFFIINIFLESELFKFLKI